MSHGRAAFCSTSSAAHTCPLVAALLTPVLWLLGRCKENVDDAVGGFVMNISVYLTILPTIVLGWIPVVQQHSTAQWVANLILLLLPPNQVTFGFNAIYMTGMMADVREQLTGEPVSVSDFLVLVVEQPYSDKTLPGPLLAVVFSLVTTPLWFYVARKASSPGLVFAL